MIDFSLRDVEYWNRYYMGHNPKEENVESKFARDMLMYMKSGNSLIEFGCGNGRDSLYFASKGINVIGIDTSSTVIQMLNNMELVNARFICTDFSGNNSIFQVQHDYCYSRFTLHAINEIQEEYTLKNVKSTLKRNGKLFVEARSVKDKIYGKGECVGRNSYIYNGHFRRFIELDELIEKLEKLRFSILYSNEGAGFAPLGDEDPVLLRIVAEKNVLEDSECL